MFWHTHREEHGVRCFWHVRAERHRQIGVELYWWPPRCGLTLGTDDEGWNLAVRLPPISLYVSLEGFPIWQPMRTEVFHWCTPPRTVTLPDRREFDVSIHDWTVRLTPWGRWGEWRAEDPWWIRGLAFDVRRWVLGRRVYTAVPLDTLEVWVPMPEGAYRALATRERVTRGFARGIKRTRVEVTLDIPKGIPFAGKGENAWDCGDDGLFGISGGTSVPDIIQRAQQSVLERRQRYGHASPEAIAEALEA